MATKTIERSYVPAAGVDWALPLYDPLVRLTGVDSLRKATLSRACIRSGDRVLDVGCGTGTLAVLIKQLWPDVHVTALDPDPKALARTRQKAARFAVSIQIEQGFSENLPYGEASFDHVFSSFMLHHLANEQRAKALSEMRRVLKPGGSFHLLDFSAPDRISKLSRARALHKSSRLRDNSDARLLDLLHAAGFVGATKSMTGVLLFGLLRAGYFHAKVPHVPSDLGNEAGSACVQRTSIR